MVVSLQGGGAGAHDLWVQPIRDDLRICSTDLVGG